MAIAFYSYTNITAQTGISVDGGTGGGRIMIYVGSTHTGSDSTTGVSWNGEAFTKSGSAQEATQRFTTIWYLFPVGTGSHTLTVTDASADIAASGVLVYTGVKKSTSPKNFNSSAGFDTSATVAITANNGDWLVGGVINNVGTFTMGANTTLRSASGSIIQIDSNGAASPTALSVSFSIADYVIAGMAIEPTTSFTATDALASSDSDTMVRGAVVAASDSLASIETIAMAKGPTFSVHDSFALSDSNSFIQKWNRLLKHVATFVRGYLLKEDGHKILQQNQGGILIENASSGTWTPEQKDLSNWTNAIKS